MEPRFCKDALREDFSGLGLRPASILLLEASVGLQGELTALLEALFDSLGPEATLLHPAFSEKGLLPPLSQAFCRRAGVQFSAHPTFPFAALGGRASLLVRDHPLRDPFGFESPVGRAYRFRGQVLWLGNEPEPGVAIALAASMTIHPPIDCSKVLPEIIHCLRRPGLLSEGLVGGIPAKLFDLASLVNEASRIFCQDPALASGGRHH